MISPVFHFYIVDGLLCLLLMILILAFCYNGLRLMKQKHHLRYLVFTILLMILDYLMLQALLPFQNILPIRAFFPPVLILICLLCSILCVGVQQYFIDKWQKTSLTDTSVKNSFDELPCGMCYYWPGGMVKLCNAQMETLCRKLTEGSLTDGDAFWHLLQNGISKKGITNLKDGKNPIYVFPDGSAFVFQKNQVAFEQYTLIELIATDISKEILLSTELKEKQEKAALINKRLKDLNQTIKEMTMEKEILNTKLYVHDNLGRALLLSKKYLTRPESTDKEELLQLLQTNIRLLKNERPESFKDPYEDIRKQSTMLGIDLRIEGSLPKEDGLKQVVEKAISTHLINTAQHAKGTCVEMECRKNQGWYILLFRNNGIQPKAPIIEGGGLSSLRDAVKLACGSMEITAMPNFELMIKLPEKQ